MLTSVLYRRLLRMPHVKDRSHARGFTLLEMLVVLVIVATTSAVVFPNLTTLGSSVDFALKREGFEQTIDGLAYRFFRENQDAVLVGTYTDEGRAKDSRPEKDLSTTIQGNLRTRSLIANQREILMPVISNYPDLKLPEGWRLEINDPVYFHSSGYCDGGNIDVMVGRSRYSYVLLPPLCHAVRAE